MRDKIKLFILILACIILLVTLFSVIWIVNKEKEKSNEVIQDKFYCVVDESSKTQLSKDDVDVLQDIANKRRSTVGDLSIDTIMQDLNINSSSLSESIDDNYTKVKNISRTPNVKWSSGVLVSQDVIKMVNVAALLLEDNAYAEGKDVLVTARLATLDEIENNKLAQGAGYWVMNGILYMNIKVVEYDLTEGTEITKFMTVPLYYDKDICKIKKD